MEFTVRFTGVYYKVYCGLMEFSGVYWSLLEFTGVYCKVYCGLMEFTGVY